MKSQRSSLESQTHLVGLPFRVLTTDQVPGKYAYTPLFYLLAPHIGDMTTIMTKHAGK